VLRGCSGEYLKKKAKGPAKEAGPPPGELKPSRGAGAPADYSTIRAISVNNRSPYAYKTKERMERQRKNNKLTNNEISRGIKGISKGEWGKLDGGMGEVWRGMGKLEGGRGKLGGGLRLERIANKVAKINASTKFYY
jgi:hypothetical protein